MANDVELTPEAIRHLDRLPDKVRVASTEFMLGALSEQSGRVGKPLVGELAALWSACRGDYRVVYQIDDEPDVVVVHRVQHRRDVYRPR